MSKTAKIVLLVVALIFGASALVVVALALVAIGVLTVGGNAVGEAMEQAQMEQTRLAISQADQELILYELTNGKSPSTAEGLAAVYDGRPVPNDAWGNELLYVSPGPNGTPYDVISYGSDGMEGGTGAAADLKLSEISGL